MLTYTASEFLPVELNRALLQFAIEQESNYVPATTSTGEADYRTALVLHQPGDWADVFKSKVLMAMPRACLALGIPSFAPSRFECQLTAHCDGAFYKLHTDSGSALVQDRVLTYVYYFYRLPKSFHGGCLRIDDSQQALIMPQNNSCVFFLSSRNHEVLPVSVPSGEFRDSRFTVNGWLRMG